MRSRPWPDRVAGQARGRVPIPTRIPHRFGPTIGRPGVPGCRVPTRSRSLPTKRPRLRDPQTPETAQPIDRRPVESARVAFQSAPWQRRHLPARTAAPRSPSDPGRQAHPRTATPTPATLLSSLRSRPQARSKREHVYCLSTCPQRRSPLRSRSVPSAGRDCSGCRLKTERSFPQANVPLPPGPFLTRLSSARESRIPSTVLAGRQSSPPQPTGHPQPGGSQAWTGAGTDSPFPSRQRSI